MHRSILAILLALAAAAAARAESTEHLLALSWQPAFCETRPDKPECRMLNAGRLPWAEAQLSLHGLWPQPRGTDYCDVSPALIEADKAGRWRALPPVKVDEQTARALVRAMPGIASGLERHEWLRHGTCHGGAGGADEYYDDTLHLMAQVNGSAVAALLTSNTGRHLETDAIRTAFDTAFGPGAGERVEVQCTRDGRRNLIQELRVHLRGTITPDAAIGDLLAAADPVWPGCAGGIVDPAGLQ